MCVNACGAIHIWFECAIVVSVVLWLTQRTIKVAGQLGQRVGNAIIIPLVCYKRVSGEEHDLLTFHSNVVLAF